MSAAKRLQTNPFLDREIIFSIADGILDTLKLISNCKSNYDQPFSGDEWTPTTDISVNINIESSPHTGQFRFHFPKKLIHFLIEHVSFSKIEGKDIELLDGVGEITNIFYGAAKTRLNILGFKLQMTIPEPYYTNKLPALTANNSKIIIPFEINNFQCFLEIIINE